MSVNSINETFVRRLRYGSWYAAWAVITVGLLVLVGWILDLQTMKSVMPGRVPMNPTTAIFFILLGVALLLSLAGKVSAVQVWVLRFCVFAVAIVGSIRVGCYLLGIETSIDRLVFANRLGENRMAPNTAANFILLAAALLLLDRPGRWSRLASQLLALLAGCVALLAAIGYAYSVTTLYGVGSFIPMALNTAIAFIVLSTGVLCARAGDGFLARIVSNSPGGATARRLLPAAILIPAALGWFRLLAQDAGWFDPLIGLSMFVVATMAILSALIWWNAGSLDRADQQRRKIEAELYRAKDAAESANRVKSSFLANMSHEIRTPLNAIIGMTDLVIETGLTAEQREYLTMVRESGESLLWIINDILDFSKIEAGKLDLDPQPFQLRDSLGDTLKSLAFRAHCKGLELACHVHSDVPENLVADAGRLRQIIVNLVGNAIKFTDTGEVVLDVALTNNEPDQMSSPAALSLQFAVRDTGVGIPSNKLHLIFEAFEQADISTTRRFGGTGLGLAISRKLVELMGGRLWVESQPGQGSTFRFTVRADVAEDKAISSLPPLLERIRDLRVLVVDDNATNRLILEEILKSWSMCPTLAASADEALRLMRQAHSLGRPIQLVLSDVSMPDVDGFQFAERIKPDKDLNGAIIMMVSSGDRSREIHRCEQAGVAAYLMKPIKQSELFDAIVTVFGAAYSDHREPSAVTRSAGSTRSLKLLLAEDSVVNQKLAVALLEQAGHQVTVVGTGKAAASAVQATAFDLVLMDVQMPEMDGLEATSRIRAAEQVSGKHVPILAMTAHAMKGDRERCLEAGMDGYVAKPIRPRELFEAIERFYPAVTPRAQESSAGASEAFTIDRAAALANCGGNAQFVRELAGICRKESAELLAKIRSAIEAGDSQQLAHAAHTLKGAVAAFDSTAIYGAARRLEELGRAGKVAAATAAIAELEQLFPAFDGELGKIAQSPGVNE